ncbi:MAG: BlaI/MecI/CopY family transcriptional regulator [Candidatus Dormibacteria bacterium]
MQKALALLGPLEARIMRVVWVGAVKPPFVVADVRSHMAELAYTTVMSTLARLAEKGLLTARKTAGVRAYQYKAAGTPTDFLEVESHRQVAAFVERYGDAALAAFWARLEAIDAKSRTRLERLAK